MTSARLKRRVSSPRDPPPYNFHPPSSLFIATLAPGSFAIDKSVRPDRCAPPFPQNAQVDGTREFPRELESGKRIQQWSPNPEQCSRGLAERSEARSMGVIHDDGEKGRDQTPELALRQDGDIAMRLPGDVAKRYLGE